MTTPQTNQGTAPQVGGGSVEPRKYNVLATPRGFTSEMVIGRVVRCESGWRFFPLYQSDPSRKCWPTPDAALKGRVTGYTLEAAP
jgi:hypothetical protein